MKIIAIGNHKGGVGKTTTAFNLSAGLAKEGLKTLIFDLDHQMNLTMCFGIENPETTIYDYFYKRKSFKPEEINKNLHFVSCCKDFAGVEQEFLSKVRRENILAEILKPLKKDYDYIILDCPPSVGLIMTNALTASDQIYIPLQSEVLSYDGLMSMLEIVQVIKTYTNPSLEIGGIFLTLYDNRKKLNRQVRKTVYEKYGHFMLDTIVRDNVSLAESPSYHEDIFKYDIHSMGAEDYLKLTKEVINKN